MSENEFNLRLRKIQDRNITKERKIKLKEEKRKYRHKFKMPSTSKLVLFMVFLLCIEIIAFCQYAMIMLGDTSAMYVLIGVPTTLVPTVLAYYWKSRSENSKNGITYEIAMLDRAQENMDIDIPSVNISTDESKG